MNIPRRQLNNSKEWLIKKGINLLTFQNKTTIDFPNWNAQAVYFIDPSNNVLEFIARHNLNEKNEEKFTRQSILNISEIGISVNSVKEFYDFIKEKFNIPIYSHISNMVSFCAAGNEEGLFIIVPLERNWFPTDIKNGVFPTIVEIENEKKVDLEQFKGYSYWISS